MQNVSPQSCDESIINIWGNLFTFWRSSFDSILRERAKLPLRDVHWILNYRKKWISLGNNNSDHSITHAITILTRVVLRRRTQDRLKKLIWYFNFSAWRRQTGELSKVNINNTRNVRNLISNGNHDLEFILMLCCSHVELFISNLHVRLSEEQQDT